MRAIILIAFFISSFSSWAQNKCYDIAFSYGIYSAPNLRQSHFKDYFLANFSYHFTKRWGITSGFTIGQFNYYDDIHSNADTEITKYTTATTNARGYDLHTYALSQYTIVSSNRFFLQAGVGVGMLLQRLKYPYREPCSSGCAVFIGETSTTTLEFPIKVESHYSLTEHISLGITGGGFINAVTPNAGFHFGPQILVTL